MKKTLVLIHGALGAGQQFNELTSHLEKHYDVHVYEIPGHGKRSGEEIDFSIQHFSHHLENFLDKNFTTPVSVFGFSMGGYIALFLALNRPELFNSITTLGTKFRWSVEEAQKETSKLDPELLLAKAPDYVKYLEKLHGANWNEVLHKTKGLMLQLGEKPLLDAESGKQINAKVRLMRGELDKMVTHEETQLIHQAIPDSKFETLPGFVHPLERLDPKQLAAALIK